MKYIVKRASDWNSMPVRDCKYEPINELIKIRKASENPPDWMKERCANIHVEGDLFVGTNKYPEHVWTLEIDDLHAFVERYGTIVLSKPENDEGLWRVLIYDDYIE